MSKDLVKKYAGKSVEEMAKEQEDLQQEIVEASQEMESEIQNFSKKIDNMVNPKTKKVMARVKRPTTNQFRRFTPDIFIKFRKTPDKIPLDVARKYEDDMYKLMEELIVEPKHPADWWKENTGDDWMACFQAHLAKTRSNMEKTIESFL